MFGAKKRLLKGQLQQFKNFLYDFRQEIGKTESLKSFDGLVYFFEVIYTSELQGYFSLIPEWKKRKMISAKVEPQIEILRGVMNEFPKNRSNYYKVRVDNPKAPIDKNNVLLGDIYGLFTQNITFWEKNTNSTCEPDRKALIIVKGQADNFLRSYQKRIITAIEGIIAV